MYFPFRELAINEAGDNVKKGHAEKSFFFQSPSRVILNWPVFDRLIVVDSNKQTVSVRTNS